MFEIFKKSRSDKEFRLVGNRHIFRTQEELLGINKEEADSAFNRYKKEIIDTKLLRNGFYKYKTNAYVRINGIGLLEYIDFQKEKYDSKTFCVNIAVMPLYCVKKYLDFCLRNRLGTLITGKDIWDFASEKIAEASFGNIAAAIDRFVLPWFEEISNENGYRAKLQSLRNERAKACLQAMDTVDDKESLIRKSIIELDLPKKMLG